MKQIVRDFRLTLSLLCFCFLLLTTGIVYASDGEEELPACTFVVTTSSIDPQCPDDINGSVSVVSVVGGSGSYSYKWNPGGPTTTTWSPLGKGTYTVQVTDLNFPANVCSKTVFLNDPPAIFDLGGDSVDPTCNGDATGYIVVDITGGTFNYNYIWYNGGTTDSIGAADSIGGLVAGTYDLEVTDDDGCSFSGSYTLTDPAAVLPNLVASNLTCSGSNDGAVTSTPSSPYGGPFNHSWSNGQDGLLNSISSLSAGTYTDTVTDAMGCVGIESKTITAPVGMSATYSIDSISCPGASDGGITISPSGGVGAYHYAWGGIAPDPGDVDSVGGLSSGTYNVTISDGSGCPISINNINVVDPSSMTLTMTTDSVICNGNCTGKAFVSVSGGASPYTYLWDDPGTSTEDSAISLCPGTYTVSVTDNNGCTDMNSVDVVNKYAALSFATQTVTDESCDGENDGSIFSAAAGGSGIVYIYNYYALPAYTLLMPPNTQLKSNLTPGDYEIKIQNPTDGTVCVLYDTVTINAATVYSIDVVATDISCSGMTDGTVTANITGGALPYTHNWSIVPDPGNVSTKGSLPPGTYVDSCTDNNGCLAIDSATVNDPGGLSITGTSQNNAACASICDGDGEVMVSGGTRPYTYLWDGLPGDSVETGLCAATYNITVIDANGCPPDATTITINNSTNINFDADTATVSCFGSCDGELTAHPSGGVAPYTFLWDDPGAQTDSIADSLCPGTYNVTITDNLGCSSTFSSDIPAAPTALAANDSVTVPTCFDSSNATIRVFPSGGTAFTGGRYFVRWYNSLGALISATIDSVTADSITGLGGGTYSVAIEDNNGCVDSQTVVITPPAIVTVNGATTSPNCSGDVNGSITLVIGGGTPGYSYLWNTAATTNTISGLAAGSYSVTVTDTNGCSKFKSFTLTQPSALSTSVIPDTVTCNGDTDADAVVIPGGGTQPYTYFWTPSGDVDSISENIGPGWYYITVTDNNGCIKQDSVNIRNRTAVSANVTGTSITCFGLTDGAALSSPTGGSSPYTHFWTSGETTPSINGKTAGIYVDIVTDRNGCQGFGSYTVVQPANISLSVSQSNVSCFDSTNGSIAVTPSGGTGAFSYDWSPSVAAATDSMATDLSDGLYLIVVTDVNGCDDTATVTLTKPNDISASDTIFGSQCLDSTGSIKIIVSGGTPNYSYSWTTGDPDDTTNIVTNLPAGNYTVTVTDSRSCTEILSYNINNPVGPLGAIVVSTEPDCYGDATGSASLTPIGGASPYSYIWVYAPLTDTLASVTNSATNLLGGSYNVSIVDDSGCVYIQSTSISQPDSLSADITVTDVSCNGDNDGIAIVAGGGGTPTYNYEWDDATLGSSVTGLSAGAHFVIITDFNSCVDTISFAVNQPGVLTASSVTTDSQCKDSCDGSSVVTPMGGTSPFQYFWDDPSAQTSPAAVGLCAGTYIVTITDTNGCTVNDTSIISEPNTIAPNVVPTDATCGVNDGSALASPSGGSGVFTDISWSTGASGATASSLAAGTYTIIVTDNQSCTGDTTFNINNSNGPTTSSSTNDVSCPGLSDGSATITANGATPPYDYFWVETGDVVASVSGLPAGTYNVNVTDANGCMTTETFTINENTSIDANLSTTSVTCNGDNDGTASVTPTGGIPPYTYAWKDEFGITFETNSTVIGLSPGVNYSVVITDASVCSSTDAVLISEPAVISINFTESNVSCNGGANGSVSAIISGGNGLLAAHYDFSWSTGSNGMGVNSIVGLTAGQYYLDVNDTLGCSGTDTTTLTEGPVINATLSSTDINNCDSCNGTATVTTMSGGYGAPFTIDWVSSGNTDSLEEDLCPGWYDVDIIDVAGCSETFSVNIINTQAPYISLSADSASCYGLSDGQTIVSIDSGGTSPFNYQWDDLALTTNDTSSNLSAGLYTVVVTDSNNCATSDTISVGGPSEVFANFTITNDSCLGSSTGMIIAAPTGGVGIISSFWSTGATTHTISSLSPGYYIDTLKYGSSCSVLDSAEVSSPTALSVAIVSQTDILCANDSNGTARALGVGGASPYTSYIWTNTLGDTVSFTFLATNLKAGKYYIEVIDNNGCIAIDSATIQSQISLSNSFDQTDTACYGICGGIVEANPSGGVSPYTFSWETGESGIEDSIVTGFCGDTINLLIVDANSCIYRDTIIVATHPEITAVITDSLASCGVANGALFVVPSGGTGALDSIIWDDIAMTQNDSVFNLAADRGSAPLFYTVTIVDDINCSASFSAFVNNLNAPSAYYTATDVSCMATNTGSVVLDSIVGGTSPIVSTLDGDPSSPWLNLYANTYTLRTEDASGCLETQSIVINDTVQSISIVSLTNVFCAGDSSGSATALAIGAVSYSWNNAPYFSTTATASTLDTGTYQVSADLGGGCILSPISVTITQHTALVIDSVVLTSTVSCYDSTDGAAQVYTSGGSGILNEYSWSNGSLLSTTTGLTAGTTYITVTDTGGFCGITDSIVVSEPDSIIVITTAITAPACGVLGGGSITISASGGTSPYEYFWLIPPPDATDSLPIVTNLIPGFYSVEITDSRGCIKVYEEILNDTSNLSLDTIITDIACMGDSDGRIDAIGINGVQPYAYAYRYSPIPAAAFSTDSFATNLGVGSYYLTVTDNNGCAENAIVSISTPAALVISFSSSNISCYDSANGSVTASITGGYSPYLHSWNTGDTSQTIDSLSPITYYDTITDSRGCSMVDSVTITRPTTIVIDSLFTTDVTCISACDGQAKVYASGGSVDSIGYTYLWTSGDTIDSTLSLCYGSSTVQVFDSMGCMVDSTFNLGATETIIATVSNDTSYCGSGSSNEVSLSGSAVTNLPITYRWYIAGDSTNSLSTSPITAYGSHQAGDNNQYVLLVSSSTGCWDSDTLSVTIFQNPVPTISSSGKAGNIEMEVTLNVATTGISYSWTPTTGLDNSTTANVTSTSEDIFSYTVLVTDSNGCEGSASIKVTPTIEIVSGFSPNGDGHNDTWNLGFIVNYPDAVVQLFNRWGQLLYETTNYYSNPWDGTYNGKDLPVGTYYYVIDLKDEEGTPPFTGPVTILK